MKKLIITIVVITLFINMFSISSNAVVAGDDAILYKFSQNTTLV